MEIENRELAAIATDKLDNQLFPQIKKTEIVTFSGLRIDPIRPNVESISIVDIAHALSNSCRYGGHCPRFYSVAEHSAYVFEMMAADHHDALTCFAGLMHDAEEAYLMDMPTPIGRQFPDYIAAKEVLREMIFVKYDIPYELYQIVKPYDQRAYENERKFLWANEATDSPEQAKAKFTALFNAYV